MTAKALLLAASLLLASHRRLAAAAPAPAARARRAGQNARTRASGSCSTTATRPISAATRSPGMFRGDYRYAAHLGDHLSDAYFAAERAAAEHDLAALHAIDRVRTGRDALLGNIGFSCDSVCGGAAAGGPAALRLRPDTL